MAKKRIPEFRSLQQEREFWQSHDVFDIFPEDQWKVSEAGAVTVESVFVSSVDRRGAVLRVPKDVLGRMGLKAGSRIQARVQGKKLVIEST